jgi:hypothetical protein
VAEAVGAGVGIDDDDVVRHRLAQTGDELVAGHARGALEQPVADARAGDRGDPQHRRGRRAQRLDAQDQRVDEVRRQPFAGGRRGQLLGEERVALGAREEVVDEARVGPALEDAGQLGDDLIAREALDRHALDDRRALGLGQQRAQRVAAVELVGAVRRDEQHALAAGVAHEEGQEVARRAIGPVDVLEHEHERRVVGQAAQEREQQLDHAALRQGAVAVALRALELGQQRRQPRGRAAEGIGKRVGVDAAQGSDDRRVGHLAVAEGDALAGQHARPSLARAARELGDEAGLADARLARDERDGRAPVGGTVEPRDEAGQLALAPDELRARHPLRQPARPRAIARVYVRRPGTSSTMAVAIR